jgi:SAM-dependent methyltransferase
MSTPRVHHSPPGASKPESSAPRPAYLRAVGNEEMRAAWTAGGEGWVAHERVFDAIFAPVTTALLAAADLGVGRRVLDVGCGSGTLLAAGAAAGAEVVGVDISVPMVEAARRRVPSATVLLADAQTTDLPGPFDDVVSRFGVMFFADPVEAFTRIRAAAPAGRLTFACWRSLQENAMFSCGTSLLTSRLPATDAVPPHAPGPTAFADPDRVRKVLTAAGWSGVEVAPYDFWCEYGVGEPAVEDRFATMLAGSLGRQARAVLEPELGPDGWAALLDEVRDELRASLDDAGRLRFPGAVWIVTAR